MFCTKSTSNGNGRRDRTARRNGKPPTKHASEGSAIGLVTRPLGFAGKPICIFSIALRKLQGNSRIGPRNISPARLPLEARTLQLEYIVELPDFITQFGRSLFIGSNADVNNGLAFMHLGKTLVGILTAPVNQWRAPDKQEQFGET